VGSHSRTAALRERLHAEHADAVALTSVPNIAYCTGFEGVFDDEPAHVALVTATSAILITDSRYVEALSASAESGEWRIVLATTSLAEVLGDELSAAGVERVALETSQAYGRYRAFEKALGVTVVECDGWVESLRQTKDAEEILAIESAQALTDGAFDHILGALHAGARESDIALELEIFMRRAGSDGVAFAPIVASGPNSALPHATPGERVFSEGDFVVLDFGARIGGYCADMTRTVVIGEATERHREVYDAVLAANAAGAAAVAAGIPARDIDAAARAVIDDRGFGTYFGHGVGHGVGREVHELPGLGPRSEALVPLGAVITVEPGIYVPGFGGVRIEDLAVVEASGARVLTRSTKELLEL
jgi:Xaa-Pro aminopeptidase